MEVEIDGFNNMTFYKDLIKVEKESKYIEGERIKIAVCNYMDMLKDRNITPSKDMEFFRSLSPQKILESFEEPFETSFGNALLTEDKINDNDKLIHITCILPKAHDLANTNLQKSIYEFATSKVDSGHYIEGITVISENKFKPPSLKAMNNMRFDYVIKKGSENNFLDNFGNSVMKNGEIRTKIQHLSIDFLQYKVTEHKDYYPVEILSDTEKEEIVKNFGTGERSFFFILNSDPVCQHFQIESGTMIRILRKHPISSGFFESDSHEIVYRLVVGNGIH